jgi:hypothetical protein
MRFRATIRPSGKTATDIPVPDEVVESLGSGKRPSVRVTINGYTYRATVGSIRGEFMLSVSAEVRERSGVAAGDEVDVDVELDTEPREVSTARLPGGVRPRRGRHAVLRWVVLQQQAMVRDGDRRRQGGGDPATTYRQSRRYPARGPNPVSGVRAVLQKPMERRPRATS